MHIIDWVPQFVDAQKISDVEKFSRSLLASTRTNKFQLTACGSDYDSFTFNRMRHGQYTNDYLGNEDLKRTSGFCRMLASDLDA